MKAKPSSPFVRMATLCGYTVALLIYGLLFREHLAVSWQYPEFLIAPIMALGSFVAGSTFLGGGAVAFPALTKILNTDPSTAKTFSLAIQSVGMTSASLYIVMRVKNIPWRFFMWYLPAAFVGLFGSLLLLEQYLAASDLRIGFTLFLLIFLLVYLWAFGDKATHYTDLAKFSRIDKQLIVKAGLIGGVVSGLLGSGADLVGFCLLALYFRLDLKLATQCSVILMASCALVGTFFQGVVFGEVTADVLQLWYIAAPVVLIGAPIGAFFCRRVTSRSLLVFICCIVASELISTLFLVPIARERLIYYAVLAVLSILMLVSLHKISRHKTHVGQHPTQFN